MSGSGENPYLIAGPALISFSGGRTSAYMLHEILAAHGGKLPDDVIVTFANTGKEREETLRFVHECEARWDVRIRWLEWRDTRAAYASKATACEETFEEVGFNSASRNGEPFAALIAMKKALPNWQARWCTGYLKVRPMHAFMAALGYAPGTYVEALGLRADEPNRIGDMIERNERDGRQCTAPLCKAGIDKASVMRFWSAQAFDLGLRDGEGNCDLCFLKGRGLKKALIADHPSIAVWWKGQELAVGATFDRRDSVEKLAREVRQSPTLFDWRTAAEFDAECGLTCAA